MFTNRVIINVCYRNFDVTKEEKKKTYWLPRTFLLFREIGNPETILNYTIFMSLRVHYQNRNQTDKPINFFTNVMQNC